MLFEADFLDLAAVAKKLNSSLASELSVSLPSAITVLFLFFLFFFFFFCTELGPPLGQVELEHGFYIYTFQSKCCTSVAQMR